jgi:hypothetical protein
MNINRIKILGIVVAVAVLAFVVLSRKQSQMPDANSTTNPPVSDLFPHVASNSVVNATSTPHTPIRKASEPSKASPHQEIIDAYQAMPLAARKEKTWQLALVQDEAVVQMLTNTLLRDFNGQTLNDAETAVMYDTLRVLGFLAAKSDSAYSLVKQGLEPGFWKANRRWPGTSDSYGGTERILVDISIVGLGYSGRPETPAILQELTKRDPIYVYQFCDAMSSAAFYYGFVSESGAEAVLAELGTEDGASDKVHSWWKTENNGTNGVIILQGINPTLLNLRQPRMLKNNRAF